MTFAIKTNNAPRFTIDACDLTPSERKEFDYLDWPAIEAGSDSATFFRYKGSVYDLGEFTRCGENGLLKDWDGCFGQTIWSGIVVKFVDNSTDSVIVGSYTS